MSDFLDQLSDLSAAEEFFEFLDVPFDPAVVRVWRLHLLKRFNIRIAEAGLPDALEDQGDDALKAAYAECLAAALKEFAEAEGRPTDLLNIRGLHEAKEAPRNFVALDSLLNPGS